MSALTARLREMTWRDIPRLASLESELFGHEGWSEATWWSELAGRPRREYLVLEGDHGGDWPAGLVGYAGLDHGGDVADVMTVAVAPAARGQGYADRLLTELLGRAAGGGAGAVMLEVRADNAPALGLYRRHGFEQVSVRRRYYQPDNVDALVMRRLLTATSDA